MLQSTPSRPVSPEEIAEFRDQGVVRLAGIMPLEWIEFLKPARKINFFYDQLLVKEPGTSERTPWHQDQPYWAVRGRQVASIWLPLDPVGRDSAVQYVRGSHLWPEHNPHHFIDDTPYADRSLSELPDIDASPGDYELLSWDVEPGDCIVFQAMIVHGAPGNRSTSRRRRAWATRWTGDDACYAVRSGETGYPPYDPGLEDGDPMDSDFFPVIWQEQIRS